MQSKIGEIYDGKVTGLTNFGAFVKLSNGESGMVHISEVAAVYVKDIHGFLQEGQDVRVKVLAVNENNKISLSIKQTQTAPIKTTQKPAPEGAFKKSFPISTDDFHTFGLLWEPDGYTVYIDGRQSGFKVGRGEGEVVSETEEFILLSTELKGFRKNAAPDPEVKDAYAVGDEFVVDFVRVYDVVR